MTRRPPLRDGFRLALGTLTAIPTRPPSRIDRDVAGTGMLLAPVATLPLTFVWIACALLTVVAPAPLLLAALAIAGIVLSTRAMHLDGLADTADGLSASYDREKALRIMRTGDVGPSGAAAVTLTLGIQIAATAALFEQARTAPLLVVVLGLVASAASRLSLAVACTRGIPAARPGGLGATVAGSVPPTATMASALFLALLGGVATRFAGGEWWIAPLVVATAVLTTTAITRRATSRLGGITGDILGAAVEISAATSLTTAALAALA